MTDPRIYILLLLLIAGRGVLSQQNLLPLQNFYRDALLHETGGETYFGPAFFPLSESQYDLPSKLCDTNTYKTGFGRVLFQRHLLEFRGDDYYLTVSPVFNFSAGKDLRDSNAYLLYQNTRGITIEGDLFDNFSFSTAFYENQAAFSRYQRSFYESAGELYPADSGYIRENAVIPNNGRTKPFKTNGFDYAYAVGNIVYRPTQSVLLMAGNNSQFIGSGYRSLFYADNNFPAPYLRAEWKINRFLHYSVMRERLLNLSRQPFSSSAEAYYQPKLYSVNMLTFSIGEKLNLSLFDGTVWSKGDSSGTTPVSGWFYNPVPFLGALSADRTRSFGIYGLDASFLINVRNRIYGQLAFNNGRNPKPGFQLGIRSSSILKQNWFVQFEYNHVPAGMYSNPANPLISYDQYNLPLAHIRGSGFDEFLFRTSWTFNRLYTDLKCVFYQLDQFETLPVPNGSAVLYNSGKIFHQQFEIGYRFNRNTNLCLFASAVYRRFVTSGEEAAILQFGLRTNLRNDYSDF